MVDVAIDAMADFMRSGRQRQPRRRRSRAAQATDELVASRRARPSARAARRATRAASSFGPSMTALTMRFAATVGARRSAPATRSSARASTTTPTSAVGDRRRARRRDRALRRSRARRRSSCPARRSRRCCPTARAGSPSPPRATRSARFPTCRGSSPRPTRAGARVYVDAVHAAPHRAIDVEALGCDALACSAYKWFGPHTAVLWAARSCSRTLHPDKLRPSPDEIPDRFELGTLPFESLAGVRAAAEFMLSLDRDDLRAHEDALLAADARRPAGDRRRDRLRRAPATARRR